MRMSRSVVRLVLAVSVVVSAFAMPAEVFAQVAAPAVAAAPKPIRVAVIGASASAGFGCVMHDKRADGDYTGSFRLADMVKLACPQLQLVTSDMSSGFFFMSPVANGAKAAKRAKDFKPDCVVALDFLFWYGYGDDAPDGGPVKSEDDRIRKFELGLKELEQFDASIPMIVGDIPDMHRAVGKMLSPQQVPSPETTAKLNARLAEWAKARPNVRPFPLAQIQHDLMDKHAIDICGTKLESTKDAPLLQRDELHPTAQGLAGLGCAIAAELKSAVHCPPDGCTPEPIGTIERARGELKKSGLRDKPATTPATAPAPAPAGSSTK